MHNLHVVCGDMVRISIGMNMTRMEVYELKKHRIILCVIIALCIPTTALAASFSFEYISWENGGITGYVAKNDDEQIMYVTITDHSLISGDEVEFRGRNRSSAVVTNVITFRKGQATRRTTSYDTYCGEGTDIKLNGVCSAYSNSQGSDRVFTTSGRWTP